MTDKNNYAADIEKDLSDALQRLYLPNGNRRVMAGVDRETLRSLKAGEVEVKTNNAAKYACNTAEVIVILELLLKGHRYDDINGRI